MDLAPVIPGLDNLSEVGRGASGTVYLATERRFGRRIAVKVIRTGPGLGKDVTERFERECLALGSLSGHPNIVAVHDSGTARGGEQYIVMEYLGGGSMADRLGSGGRCTPAEVVRWGIGLAGALETAHRSGIVHRDVKPENVLFSDYGTPKLGDFGIARIAGASETGTGLISATLLHAAPEVLGGGGNNATADQYSLASVLFTLLHGQAPFYRVGDESIAPLIARIATRPPPDLRATGVPDRVASVIERALAKEPADRFGSVAEMGKALQRAARAAGVAGPDLKIAGSREVVAAASVINDPVVPAPSEHSAAPERARDREPEQVPEQVPVVLAGPARLLRSRRAFLASLLLAVGLGATGGVVASAPWEDEPSVGSQEP